MKNIFKILYGSMLRNLFIISLLLSSNLFAQSGKITGIVKDPGGNPLPGVNIVIVDSKLGAAALNNGRYEIKNIPFGVYEIEFSSIGYTKRIVKNFRIMKDETSLDIVLRPEILQAEQVVVTAGKHQQKLEELTVSASILTADNLAKKNFYLLDDALRYVPGLNITLDQVSIRGSSGYSRGAGTRVLVALDGIPFYAGDTGEIIWEIFPVTEIDKVEVIKGAASSLYGSTAIGGVINVLTKKIIEQPRTHIKTFYGAYDKPLYKEWDWSGEYRTFNGVTISHSNKFNDLGISISLTRLENLSYRQNDFSKRYIGYLKTSYNFTPSSSLTLFGNILSQRRGNFIYWKDVRHALQPPDADQNQRVSSDRYMLGMIYKRLLSDNLLFDLKSSYYRTKWEDQTSSRNSSTAELFRGEIQTNFTPAEKLMLIGGAEISAGNVNSNIFGKPNSFGTGVYFQAEYNFNFLLTAVLGFRYDYSKLDTLAGSSLFSPKLGLNYRLSESTIVRSSIGTGFRAPSLAEAFTSTTASGITIKPNPKLKSERNISFEAAVNQQLFTNMNFDAAIFQNEFYDLIEPSVDKTDGLVFFDNVTRARIQGAEVQLNYHIIPNKLIFNTAYTYLWARDVEKKKTLKYRPRHLVYTNIDVYINDFEFGIDFRYWSRVEEIDHELVDLGLVPDGDKRVAVYVLDFRGGLNLLRYGIPGKVYLSLMNSLNYNYHCCPK